jgi:hypothetical protein
MKGIKLTPFLLFVILLVVLVLAMLFGTTMKPLLEHMDTQHTTWSVGSDTTTINIYDKDVKLDAVNFVPGNGGIFFDSRNGNIITTTSDDAKTFTMIDRQGKSIQINNNDPSNKQSTTMGTSNLLWSQSISTDHTIIYCPNDVNTVVILLNHKNNTIDNVFRNNIHLGSQTTGSMGPTNIETGGNIDDYNNTSGVGEDNQTSGQTKIAKGVFYSNDLGIIVHKGTPEHSKIFESGVSVQHTTDTLVLSTLIAGNKILSAIIVKGGHKYEGSAHYTPYTRQEPPSGSQPESETDNTISIKLTTTNDDNDNSNNDNSNNDNSNNDNSNNSCNSQYTAKPSYTCPNNTGDKSQNSDYIRKSEIVPPVCPGCPPCPNISPSTCNLSINSKGEMVDCTGKKYKPEGEIPGASPGTWEGSLGKAVSSSVGSVAGVAEKGLSETGDVANKTLDTASGAFDKTLDTAGGLAGDLSKGVGDVASGLGKGLTGLGSDASKMVQGVSSDASKMVQGVSSDVAGLGNNVINSTTGLAEDAGSGLMQLSQQQQQQQHQQQQQQMMQQHGYMQPGSGYGYPMQQPGTGYGNQMQHQGMGYSYPQQCPKTGSNFMPITNDFSQFA